MVRTRRFSWPLGRPLSIAFGLLIFWALLSALWAETPGLAVPSALQMGGLIVAGSAVLAALPSLDERDRRDVGIALTAGTLVLFAMVVEESATVGVVENFLRHALTDRQIGTWLPARFKVSVSVCGIIIPALMVWHWRQGNRLMLALLPAGLMLSGFLSGSHTGTLAAITALLVALASLVAARLTAMALGGVIIAAFLGAPLVISRLPPPFQLAAAVELMPNSMMHRLSIWNFATAHILQRPMLGWGFNASRALPGGEQEIPVPVRSAKNEIVALSAQAMPLHPHNLMLQVWLEMGVVGALGYLAAALCVIAAALRNQRLTAPALGIMAGSLVVGAASFGAWQAWWVACQWLFALLCIILSRSALDGAGPDRALTGNHQL